MKFAPCLIIASSFALASCSGKADNADDASAPAQTAATSTVDAGKAAFAPCSVCHSALKAEGNKIGPNLFGVVGRKPGSAEGFTYSAAMKAKSGVWDEAAINAFIESPMKSLPGNKMTYAGMADAAQRKAVVEYLKAQK